MTTASWNKAATGDFYDPSNWAGGDIPQSHTCQNVNISGTDSADRAVAVANAASYGQISSLSIGDYGTLKITAQNSDSASGYVFSAHSMEIAPTGEVIVDTPAKVELGEFTQDRGGSITIIGNNNNVVFDGNGLNGTGSLNLVNSTLGSATTPVATPNLSVTLQQGSTLYSGWLSSNASVTFDPSTKNTLVLDPKTTDSSTAIYGLSQNSVIAISQEDGVTPVSASFTQTGDSTYQLVIGLSDGQKLTLSDVHTATGFVPGSASITTDANGYYDVTYTDTSSAPSGYDTDSSHTSLQTIYTDAESAGAGGTYTTTGVVNHSAEAVDRFTGTGTNWSDASNWSLGTVPQNNSCNQAVLQGSDSAPVNVVMSQADVRQFVSLSVMNNASLTVTAQNAQNPSSYVFTTAGTEVRGNGSLTIATPSKVELGGVSAIDGTLTIRGNNGNVVFDNDMVNGSGHLVLDGSALGSQTNPVSVTLSETDLENGSTLYTNLWNNKGSINILDNSTNTIVMSGETKSVSTKFTGVNENTVFAIDGDDGVTPVSAAYTPNGTTGSYTLTITMADGSVSVLSDIVPADGFIPSATSITKDENGDYSIITNPVDTCFVEGTLIRTDRGDVAVEDLKEGDQLIVVGVEEATRPVVWTGSREMVVNQAADESEAGYPVRVLKDAIAENVPSRDLLITAEHCLFIDGSFVPVRMLVNGVSVYYDHSVTSYRYFHVETAQHSVIIAENTATESYLDTGHRRTFTGNAVVSLVSRNLSWENDAAAPLMTKREEVEAVHQRLLNRASAELALPAPVRPALTRQSELRFETLDGQVLRRLGEKNGVVTVEVPANVSQVRIVSRTSRPADVVGPFVDDRRQLGVLVGNVTLQDGPVRRAVQSHLNGQAAGWHAEERADARWTNGQAILDLGNRAPGVKGLMTVQIAAAGPYLVKTAEDASRLCA